MRLLRDATPRAQIGATPAHAFEHSAHMNSQKGLEHANASFKME